MNNEGSKDTKKKIILAAVGVGAVLCILTFIFIRGVKSQLWEQSVENIIESTQQGRNTLRIQLQDDYESIAAVAGYIERYSKADKKEIEEIVTDYAQVEHGIRLYLEDGSCIPADSRPDTEAEKVLADTEDKKGIINPHISSASGLKVFDLFMKITMQDGTEGYFLKEYEVENIVSSFSLSFYNNEGFSYVVNTQGEILIRSPHPNSNKTVKNLFDILPETENNPDSLKKFSRSLKDLRTGWAVFSYQGEGSVFCYTPLKLQTDWYLVSIIPEKVVGAQTNKILYRAMALIASILAGILLLAVFYHRYVNKANRRLGNQAKYIGHLYNAIPEGIALLTAGSPHRFIQLNQEGLRLLGYPENAANDLLGGEYFQDMLHLEDREKNAKLFENTAMSDRKNVFECRIRRADGSFFWAGGIVEKTLDENGGPVLIAAFHDVTDEKLEEEAAEREKLQERITLVGAISNAYPVIIHMNLTKDTLGFIYTKPGLMVRLGEQRAYTELFEDMFCTVHPDYLEEFKRRFAPENLTTALGKDKKEIFLEVKQILSDGKYHWTSTQIIYVDNPYSEDKLAILISRRTDEQRREEERQNQALQSALDNARAANKAKSEFLSNMSHDIRTPMNAIVGMTAIAEAHLDDKQRVGECLRKIEISSRHLLSLINDILDMSKIESGKLSLRAEPFDFRQLVEETVELIKAEADAKTIQINMQLESKTEEMAVGDPLRIRQIYINILSNAVKYTPEGGSVFVEARQEKGARRGYRNHVFTCSDDGIGMGAEFLDKLFQPFERAQDSTNSRIAGTGLGMAITKNLTDLMNGSIQVKSRPGKGSVFTVVLPLPLQDVCQTDQLRSQAEYQEGFQGISGKVEYSGKRLLLVEDNEINREIARELLGEMGLKIEEACDGEEAVRKVEMSREGYYDLVLMDIQMPKMDGYEAVKTIRSLSRGDAKTLPVVAMTANAFDEDVRLALLAGMNAHLAKPVDRAMLEEMLYRFLK